MDTLLSFIQDNLKSVALLALAFVGIMFIIGAKRLRWSDVMSTSGIAIIGVVFVAAAAGIYALGADVGNKATTNGAKPAVVYQPTSGGASLGGASLGGASWGGASLGGASWG